MNCTDFETVVIDLARRQMMDAAARDDALAHAGSCARCAGRLADERALTAGFAVLRGDDAARNAPLRVEQALLVAVARAEPRRPHWMKRAGIGAVAAAIVISTVIALRRPEPGNPPRNAAVAPPAAPEAAKAPEPPPARVIPPAPRPLRRERQRAQKAARRAVEPAEREIATEFIALVYDPDPPERGRLVRVKLPRSALVTFGLPMNEDRSEDRVKADVLLGEDGVARAIRFVR